MTANIRWWRIHVRASENKDGTGTDTFYSLNRKFESLRAAKREAKRYEGAVWLRELRIYQETK